MARTLARCALLLTLLVPVSAAAADFAAPGTKAVLSVDYAYASSGRQSSSGLYDPYEWRVRRALALEAQLTAQPPTAMPTVQRMDAAQVKQLERKAQAVATQMAPMQRDIEKAMARCGNDEACMTREAQKLAGAMAGDPAQMAALAGTRKDIESMAGAPRYQAWRPTSQKGSFTIDEAVQVSVTDPICTSKPRHRCTRRETRQGAGEIPAAKGGASAVELDAATGTLSILLPVALAPLAYTEVIETDEPEGTHETPTPKGPRKKQGFFRVSAGGTSSGFMHEKPVTVALQGGWRSQAGEYSVPLTGPYGDTGTLTVRWRFRVQ